MKSSSDGEYPDSGKQSRQEADIEDIHPQVRGLGIAKNNHHSRTANKDPPLLIAIGGAHHMISLAGLGLHTSTTNIVLRGLL